MRLIIVRHGETEWNALKQTQGMSDTQLSDKGRRQARRLSYRLRPVRVAAAFTSPLGRAVETAHIITKFKHLDIIEEPDLREINFGDWEGRTFDRIRELYPKELETWTTRPQDYDIPRGESLMDVAARCTAFIERAKARYERQTVLAVTHSVPSKLLVAISIGLPVENIHSLRMDNASLTIIDFYPDRPIMRLFNDTTHLQEGVIWPK